MIKPKIRIVMENRKKAPKMYSTKCELLQNIHCGLIFTFLFRNGMQNIVLLNLNRKKT